MTAVLKGRKFTLYVWKWVVVVMFPLVFTICAKFLGSQVKKIRHSRRNAEEAAAHCSHVIYVNRYQRQWDPKPLIDVTKWYSA